VTQRTLTMIKPDAFGKGVSGHILQRFLDEGFVLKGLRMVRLDRTQAEKFYQIHKERPFYKDLVAFMTSGPIVAACLERDDAVAHLRAVMGPTDSTKAPPETIRGQFGTSIERNAVHGSDSPENACIEIAFFFPGLEL